MCQHTYSPPMVKPPEDSLADLIKRKAGVSIDPVTLRLFLVAHWGRIANLAHCIHENEGGKR